MQPQFFYYLPFGKFVEKYPEYIDKIKLQYLELLSELTTATTISNEVFLENIQKISNNGEIFICCTFLDPSLDNFVILGSGTGFIEPKIIRGGLNACHIEDIVVHKKYRGYGIAKKIIELLVDYSKLMQCYKVILDTQDETVAFYEKCGFSVKGNQMAVYF